MSAPPLPRHTLVLRLHDRPGALELITATFSHRGISLLSTLGCDGDQSPDGYATVVVRFAATPERKEAVKRTLERLSRVLSVAEPGVGGAAVRLGALVRLAPEAPPLTLPPDVPGCLDPIIVDAETGEALYALIAAPDHAEALLQELRTAGHLRAVTLTLLAL